MPVASESSDPRIRIDLAHLRRLALEARALSFLPKQPSHSVLNGRHASRLRGRGLNFEELRNYNQGDDIRTIDWKVTARTGKPHVRVYTEERDRPALLVVDQRMSMFFGSQTYMKSVVAAEAAAIAAHRILAQGDRVGGLVFNDAAIAEHRPVRNQKAVNRLLASIADANAALRADAPVTVPLPLNQVLGQTLKIAKTNYLVLVFSDFDALDGETERLLRAIAQNNDLILFDVADPLSRDMPEALKLTVSDGDLQAEINAADGTVRKRLEHVLKGRLAELHRWSRKYGFPVVPLTTDAPALDQLLRLFGHRGA
ncbi:MAG: DUF58 domain-containing protein [Dinoroseobacter sp.]|nr:DUF58 domain-containing protein [Dinoroseobacter sp.]